MKPSLVFGLLIIGTAARAQTSLAACGPLPDSTSRQVIKAFGELRACLVATKVAGTDAVFPREWAAKGATVVIETQRPDDNRRLSLEGLLVHHTINGREAPMDSVAERWQRAVLELLDAKYEADELRSRSTSLQLEIDSLPARLARTKDSLGLVESRASQLSGLILNAQSRRDRAELQVSGLEGQRDGYLQRADAAESEAAMTKDDNARRSALARAQSYRAQAQRVSTQISGIMREAGGPEAMKSVARAQAELQAMRPEHTLAMLRLQLGNYEATNVDDLEAQLTALDAPRRLPELDARVEQARLALLAVLEARGTAPSP
jgi:hypothetical protein